MTDLRDSQHAASVFGTLAERTHRRVEWPARIVALVLLVPLVGWLVFRIAAWWLR
jgi:hypothetical protein